MVKDLFIFSSKFFFYFWAYHFQFRLLCTSKGCGRIFPLNFNYQRCQKNSNINIFLDYKFGPIVMTDFFVSFYLPFSLFSFTLNLYHFAPLNGAGQIFSVNFNYQRCLENSNMINFWLTTWVTLWWQIFVVFFSHFLPWTRVCNKQSLINSRPKYYFDNPVSFLETKGKNWLISDPHFVYRNF